MAGSEGQAHATGTADAASPPEGPTTDTPPEAGLVVEPVAAPRRRPSEGYVQGLRDLGASAETVELATGERILRRRPRP
jgi:hypothetical protein